MGDRMCRYNRPRRLGVPDLLVKLWLKQSRNLHKDDQGKVRGHVLPWMGQTPATAP